MAGRPHLALRADFGTNRVPRAGAVLAHNSDVMSGDVSHTVGTASSGRPNPCSSSACLLAIVNTPKYSKHAEPTVGDEANA